VKVILEVQSACMPEPRGTAFYTIQVIQNLLKRKKNNYELTLFDENRERGNRKWVDKYFGEYKVPIHECTTLNYRKTFSDNTLYNNHSYNDYTKTSGDIYHFFGLVSVPERLVGNMVVSIHDMLHIRYPDYYSQRAVEMARFNLNIIKKVKPTVITLSEYSKKEIIHFSNIPEEKIIVVPGSYDESSCLLDNNIDLLRQLNINSPYLLFLSAIAKNKNLSRVIEAFEMIADKYPDLILVVAGGNAALPDDQALIKLKNSRYSSRIKKIGYVNEELKHTLYSNATAFLFPTLFEGFGLPILEAMARGCPVITSNTTSLPEVAGNAAILIDPYDSEQIAIEIERIISSESLQNKLYQKGLLRVKNYSWDKTAEMIEKTYKRILL